jgi:hypothetical protein
MVFVVVTAVGISTVTSGRHCKPFTEIFIGLIFTVGDLLPLLTLPR